MNLYLDHGYFCSGYQHSYGHEDQLGSIYCTYRNNYIQGMDVSEVKSYVEQDFTDFKFLHARNLWSPILHINNTIFLHDLHRFRYVQNYVELFLPTLWLVPFIYDIIILVLFAHLIFVYYKCFHMPPIQGYSIYASLFLSMYFTGIFIYFYVN